MCDTIYYTSNTIKFEYVIFQDVQKKWCIEELINCWKVAGLTCQILRILNDNYYIGTTPQPGYRFITRGPGQPACGGPGSASPITILDSVANSVALPDDFGCHLLREDLYDDIRPALAVQRCHLQAELCECLAEEEQCVNLPQGVPD